MWVCRRAACSGLSYVVEYAEEAKQFEEVIEDKGVRVFVDPAATMFLIGATMDYREGKFESGFVFENPNAKGTCGLRRILPRLELFSGQDFTCRV